MNPTPVISLSDLDWQAQEEIAATVKANPRIIPFACRMALTPARPWYTIFAHTPEEHACIAGMPGFSRVVGIPAQEVAHSYRDSYVAALYRDAKWYAQSEYWVRPVSFIRAEDEAEFNRNFTSVVCPETGYVHYQSAARS